jgi:hypothetical protein
VPQGDWQPREQQGVLANAAGKRHHVQTVLLAQQPGLADRPWRTARSRRPATRRPPQAGPVRSRHGHLPRPGQRTGTSRSAVHGTRPRACRCAGAGTQVRSAPGPRGSRLRLEAGGHIARLPALRRGHGASPQALELLTYYAPINLPRGQPLRLVKAKSETRLTAGPRSAGSRPPVA